MDFFLGVNFEISKSWLFDARPRIRLRSTIGLAGFTPKSRPEGDSKQSWLPARASGIPFLEGMILRHGLLLESVSSVSFLGLFGCFRSLSVVQLKLSVRFHWFGSVSAAMIRL